jgi:hypothetical protein
MKRALIRYGLGHWKLLVHMLFKTARFGVNNHWWSSFPSPIAWSWSQRVWGLLTVMPIVRNYQSMKVRANLGWVPEKMVKEMGLTLGNKKTKNPDA